MSAMAELLPVKPIGANAGSSAIATIGQTVMTVGNVPVTSRLDEISPSAVEVRGAYHFRAPAALLLGLRPPPL